MARQAVISSAALKGYLLEEVVTSLIGNAGYRLLTRPEEDPHDLDLMANDVTNSGRGFCYSYRYALCSTSGFTPGAQAYALAHQIALLDLSHREYDELRGAIDTVGDYLRDAIDRRDRVGIGAAPDSRGGFLRRIRASLRRQLWGLDSPDVDSTLLPIFRPLLRATQNIGELFVGVSVTGFVILLKADSPERMIEHMQASTDGLICSLRLDEGWLAEARYRLATRGQR